MENACLDCGKCCLETEMILSHEDVKKIINNFESIIKQDDFCYLRRDGFFHLKNYNHHCYFYEVSTKTCKIYEIRPQGCRFYPLIYDIEKKKCTLDKDCPRTSIFYPNKFKRKETCLEIVRYLKNQLNIKI